MCVTGRGRQDLPLIVCNTLFGVGKRRTVAILEQAHERVDLRLVLAGSGQRLPIIVELFSRGRREDVDRHGVVVGRFQDASRCRERAWGCHFGIAVRQRIGDGVPILVVEVAATNKTRLHQVTPPEALLGHDCDGRATSDALHPLVQGVGTIEGEVGGHCLVLNESPVELAVSLGLLVEIVGVVGDGCGCC